MTRARVWLIAGLWFAGVCYACDWQPWRVLFAFDGLPLACWLGGVALFAAARRPLALAWERTQAWPLGIWLGGIAGAFLFLAAWVARGPLQGVPHAPDEIAYLWQARQLAMGALSVPSPLLPEFFHQTFMVNNGRWFSLFQPGWPAALVPFAALGLEWLANPFYGACVVALSYPVARLVLPVRTARLVPLFVAAAPMHLALSGTLFAHTWSLLLTELVILAAWRLVSGGGVRVGLLLGAALGWLFLTRALNGTLMVVVTSGVLGWGLWRGRVAWRPVAVAAGVAALFLACQLGYNQALTGAPLTWPQDLYFRATEPKPNCHALGFGKEVGCPLVHGERSFPQGFTPADALNITHERLGTFLVTFFGFQLLFWMIGAAFFAPTNGAALFLLAVFLAHVAGYFFWYFYGVWGRYYYEAGVALLVLAVAGLAQTDAWLGAGTRGRRLRQALAPALGLGYFVFNGVFFVPPLLGPLATHIAPVDRRVLELAERLPERSLVFVSGYYDKAFLTQRPDREASRLFVHDLGEAADAQMRALHPGWRAYALNADTLAWHELPAASAPTWIPATSKWPIYDRTAPYPYAFQPAGRESAEPVLRFPAMAAGAHLAWMQPVTEAGTYALKLRLLTGPAYGRVRVSLDTIPLGTLDAYAPQPGVREWELATPRLASGAHRLAFIMVGNRADGGYELGLSGVQWRRDDARN